MSTTSASKVAWELAQALVEGAWPDEGDLVARGARVLGRKPRWLRPLIRRLVAALPDRRCRTEAVASFLIGDDRFRRAWWADPAALGRKARPEPVMAPAPGPPSTWPVPAITTPSALAGFLGLDPGHLDWLADLRGLERLAPDGPARRYDYRWQAKRSGAPRLIEAPRPRLKAAQRRLLDGVLGAIPPHEAAHGFRPGRSVRTFVEPHAGRAVVLKVDLHDFFPSITSVRVAALFRTAGYPDAVARLLTGLCTNRAPSSLWRGPDGPPSADPATRRLYRGRHLPQGAPTSPSLANLCAYRLDCRLAGLARSAGASYTRYADDLAFSGDDDLARSIGRFATEVAAIALEERFPLNHRKTRVMRRGVRQVLAGAVVNDRPNVARDDFDALKATLHNCLRHGPSTQDRAGLVDFRAHLLGRIAHVATLNPARAAKLRAAFDRVAW